MGRIVVGLDGSASAKEALRWAADGAGRRGDVVEVVCVWDNPCGDMWLPELPAEDPLAHFRVAPGTTESSVLGERPPAKVEAVVAEGHVAQVLVDRARGADMPDDVSRGHDGMHDLPARRLRPRRRGSARGTLRSREPRRAGGGSRRR